MKRFYRIDPDWLFGLWKNDVINFQETKVLMFVTSKANGAINVPVNESLSQIGDAIGMKRQNVNSSLKSLIKKGLVKSHKKGYILLSGVMNLITLKDVVLNSDSTESVQDSVMNLITNESGVMNLITGCNEFNDSSVMNSITPLSYSKENIIINNNINNRERENRRATPLFPFFPYAKYPDIDCVLINDLKSKFDLLWGCWLNTRRGTQQDAKDSFERVANETGLNEFADRLEIAFGMYMRSDEWNNEIIKSLPKWLPEFTNWEEEYYHQLKNKNTKPLEKGKTWERMREHVESERK